MNAARMLVSMSTSGPLYANARTAARVYGPTPGNGPASAFLIFPTATISFAVTWKYFPLLLYPSPLHTLRTSESGAFARMRTVGNLFKNSLYFSITRDTCVCCNITSETRMRYGSFVFLHGSSCRPSFFQYLQTRARNRAGVGRDGTSPAVRTLGIEPAVARNAGRPRDLRSVRPAPARFIARTQHPFVRQLHSTSSASHIGRVSSW